MAGISLWGTPLVRADGGLPGSLAVLLPADRAEEILLVTNFGLILSDDGAKTWQWTCEQPATSQANLYALGPAASTAGATGDRLFAASPVSGLAVSDDESCSWHGVGGALSGAIVSDFFPDPTDPRRVLAAGAAPAADAGSPVAASLYLSMDAGSTFAAAPLYTTPPGATIVGVEISRSDPSVIYLGYYLVSAGARDPVLVRSADGGQSWTSMDLQASLGPAIVRILAVDPADSQVVYLRVTGVSSEIVAVTRDGGQTFAQPLTIANGQVSAFARLASGTVLVGALVYFAGDAGAMYGAGYRSTDGGASFVPWTIDSQPHLVGLAERVEAGRSTLYLSGTSYIDLWALATSTDEGLTVTPVLTGYEQVAAIKACAQASCRDSCNFQEQRGVWTPAVCTANVGADGGTAPTKSAGCRCDATGGGSGILGLAISMLMVVIPLTRGSHRRGTPSSDGERLDSRRSVR